MPSQTPDNPTQPQPTSPAGTFLLTPEQHLAMAELVEKVAGRKGGPTKARAAQMAKNHRLLARVIEERISQRQQQTPAGASSAT